MPLCQYAIRISANRLDFARYTWIFINIFEWYSLFFRYIMGMILFIFSMYTRRYIDGISCTYYDELYMFLSYRYRWSGFSYFPQFFFLLFLQIFTFVNWDIYINFFLAPGFPRSARWFIKIIGLIYRSSRTNKKLKNYREFIIICEYHVGTRHDVP